MGGGCVEMRCMQWEERVCMRERMEGWGVMWKEVGVMWREVG